MTRVLTCNGLTVKVSKFEACRRFPVRFMLVTNDNVQIQFRHYVFPHFISIQESENFLSIQLAYPVLQAKMSLMLLTLVKCCLNIFGALVFTLSRAFFVCLCISPSFRSHTKEMCRKLSHFGSNQVIEIRDTHQTQIIPSVTTK